MPRTGRVSIINSKDAVFAVSTSVATSEISLGYSILLYVSDTAMYFLLSLFINVKLVLISTGFTRIGLSFIELISKNIVAGPATIPLIVVRVTQKKSNPT